MTFDGYWDDPMETSTRYTSYSSLSCQKKEEPNNEMEPIRAYYDKRLWQQAKVGTGTDVLIKCGEVGLTLHKIRLMDHSAFFAGALKEKWDAGQHTVELQEMDGTTFRALMRILYTGTLGTKTQQAVSQDLSQLASLLKAADYLGIDGILQWVTEFVRRCLKAEIKLSLEVYSELFSVAVKNMSFELLKILIENERMKQCWTNKMAWFIENMRESTGRNEMTKEVYAFIKSEYSYGDVRDVLRDFEKYNPVIAEFAKGS